MSAGTAGWPSMRIAAGVAHDVTFQPIAVERGRSLDYLDGDVVRLHVVVRASLGAIVVNDRLDNRWGEELRLPLDAQTLTGPVRVTLAWRDDGVEVRLPDGTGLTFPRWTADGTAMMLRQPPGVELRVGDTPGMPAGSPPAQEAPVPTAAPVAQPVVVPPAAPSPASPEPLIPLLSPLAPAPAAAAPSAAPQAAPPAVAPARVAPPAAPPAAPTASSPAMPPAGLDRLPWLASVARGRRVAVFAALDTPSATLIRRALDAPAAAVTAIDERALDDAAWDSLLDRLAPGAAAPDGLRLLGSALADPYLPEQVGAHDLALCLDRLHRVPDPLGTLRALRAVAGRCVVSVPVAPPQLSGEAVGSAFGEDSLDMAELGALYLPGLGPRLRPVAIAHLRGDSEAVWLMTAAHAENLARLAGFRIASSGPDIVDPAGTFLMLLDVG